MLMLQAVLTCLGLLFLPIAGFAQGNAWTLVPPPTRAHPLPQFLPRATEAQKEHDVPAINALQRETITLPPGATKDFPIDLAQDSVVIARMTAVGEGADRASLQIVPGEPGKPPVAGKPVRNGDATLSSAKMQASKGSHLSISVSNQGSAAVNVELVFGAMSWPE